MSVLTQTEARATPAPAHWLGNARRGIALLAGGAVLVGGAILAEGDVGRGINGLGAVAWVAGTTSLAWQLRGTAGFAWRLPMTVAIAVVIASVVRPNELGGALIGFGAAGVVVAATARRKPVAWAALVPGIYLPAHILIAIGRSLLAGAARVRTEPPPTAAIVPLAMVGAAVAGGLIVELLRRRR